MKKFIPIILVLIFFCLGIIVKNEPLRRHPSFLANQYLNECLQFILWLPIGLIGGMVLLLVPKDFLNWLSDIKNTILEDSTPIRIHPLRLLAVRFYGVVLFGFTLWTMFSSTVPNACKTALGFAH